MIIKNSGLLKKEGKKKESKNKDIIKKLANFLEENIEEIKESNILVFVEQEIEKNELYKVIEKYGEVCEFERLKPVSIAKRLKAIANAYKVNVDDQTLNYLIETVGTNMQDLINEIRKLIEYVGENESITKKNVENLAIKQIDSVIFDLTDNLGNKNTKKAIDTLHGLMYNKEPLQMILIMLYNHFKKIYFTKLSEKYKRNLAESLGLKPNQMFLTSKYKKQAGYFSEQELKNILQEITDLDANYKIGLIDLEIGLEAILCNYCS